MEGFKKLKEEIKSEIEKNANYEGNNTILFLERISNPKIKSRLVDNIYEHYSTDMSEIKYQDCPRDKKDIETDLDEKIKKSLFLTNVEYPENPKLDIGGRSDDTGYGLMYLCPINPDTGDRYSEKAMSIIEAHEKGHEIRQLPNFPSAYSDKIKSGFDFSKVKFSESYKNFAREKLKADTDEDISDDDLEYQIKEYYGSINELIERMSQIKNYFGMKGEEIFTKEHLQYAKKHYCNDTGHHSQIQPFFDAITPETEDKFIELMNTLGI